MLMTSRPAVFRPRLGGRPNRALSPFSSRFRRWLDATPSGFRHGAAAIVALFLLTPVVAAAEEQRTSLAAIVAAMPEGWTELPHTSIRSVFVTQQQFGGVWGVVGPDALITAWNGAAYDPRGHNWYFQGGGHADYGGNEVYRFSFDTLSWKRLTDPSPYPARKLDGTLEEKCPPPVSGAPSMHTYAGKVYAHATRTMFVFPQIGFCPSGVGMVWIHNQVWEFNPEDKPQNGLAPLTWRKHEVGWGGFPRAVDLPDGMIAIGNNSSDGIFDPRTARIVATTLPRGDESEGTSAFDAKRSVLWIINRGAGLSQAPYREGRLIQRAPVSKLPDGLEFEAGIAVHEPTGRVVFWNGRSDVHVYDPASKEWTVLRHAAGPTLASYRTIYSKWIYLPEVGAFAGYQNPNQGVWLYKLPAKGGQPVSAAKQ